MKPSIISDDKVIITTAITGGIHGKWANPNLPITPEEQAQDALDCYNAGAAILHLHVRGEDGQNTPDIDVYNKSVRLIGEGCPIIRQIGNGIGARIDASGAAFEDMLHGFEGKGLTVSDYIKQNINQLKDQFTVVHPTLEQRLNLLNIEPQPEMHTINAGTFEFMTSYGLGIVFNNPRSFNEEYVKRCKEKGIGIEIEVYDLSHIENVMELVDKGLLSPPLHFSIVLGIMGGTAATPGNLMHMVEQLPEGSTWQVVTVGKYNVRSTVIAMSMGGNVRTGLEDNIYYQKGELAKGNAQLVERMVRIAKEIGREPATVEEAKQILGLY